MNLRLIRFFSFLFGITLFLIVIVVTIPRHTDDFSQAMILSSNFRNNDQALYLATPDGAIFKQLTRIPGSEYLEAISPDGQWIIIFSRVNFNHYAIHLPTNRIRHIAESNTIFKSIQADNTALFFSVPHNDLQGRGLHRIDLQTGHDTWIADTKGTFYFAHLDPSQRWLYFQGSHSGADYLRRYNIDTQQIETIADGTFRVCYGWTPDKQWLLIADYNSSDGSHQLLRISPDGSQRESILAQVGNLQVRSTSPDQQWMIAGSFSLAGTYRFSADGTAPVLITTDPESWFIGWSSDSQWMYIGEQTASANNEEIHTIFGVHVTTGQRQTLTESTAEIGAFISSSRSRLTISRVENDQAVFYTLDTDQPTLRKITQLSGDASFSDWSPDGQWFYFETDDPNRNKTLYRIRHDGTQKSVVHSTFKHNNGDDIFLGWIPIQSDSWQSAPLIGFAIVLFITSLALIWRRTFHQERIDKPHPNW